MTINQSRADALTDLQIMEALEAAGVKWQEQRSLANDREILTYGSTPAADIIAGIRTLLAASPVEQPAAAPIEAISNLLNEAMNRAVANGADSRSMPDEYVAIAHFVCYPQEYGCVTEPAEKRRALTDEAAAAIYEAAAKTVSVTCHTFQSWSAELVRAIISTHQTGIARATASPAAEVVAWVRKHPDTGELSGDWLWNDNIEQCRKDSGVWFPLGFIHAPHPAREDRECTYENGDGICRECAELAQRARLEASVRRYQEMVDVLKQRLHDVTHPEAVEPQASEVKAATGLGWRVRELRAPDGTLMDCFVEAPAEDDMPYGLQVLGDDYAGYGDLARKHEHCKMIVEWANRND